MADEIKNKHNVQNYLLTTYAPLINSSIKSLKGAGRIPQHIEDHELHEPAIRGLMEAVRDYNHDKALRTMPDSKNPFATFASTRIKGRIQDHADSMHQLPKHLRVQASRYAKLQQQKPEGSSED